MYSLGHYLVSSDDDMRPDALIESSVESLDMREMCRGKLFRVGEPGYVHKSFDLLAAFRDVLGKKVSASREL